MTWTFIAPTPYKGYIARPECLDSPWSDLYTIRLRQLIQSSQRNYANCNWQRLIRTSWSDPIDDGSSPSNHFNIRSGYLPNIVAVNSAKFITIYREFGRRDLARYSRVRGVRGCFKLYLLAVTRHKKFVFAFQTWQIIIVWNGQVFLWDLMSKINILRSWDKKYVYTNTR